MHIIENTKLIKGTHRETSELPIQSTYIYQNPLFYALGSSTKISK